MRDDPFVTLVEQPRRGIAPADWCIEKPDTYNADADVRHTWCGREIVAPYGLEGDYMSAHRRRHGERICTTCLTRLHRHSGEVTATT